MAKKLTPQLEKYKEEFDFLHKKIGELEWEYATRSYNRIAVRVDEVDAIQHELGHYHALITRLLEKVESEVRKVKRIERNNDPKKK